MIGENAGSPLGKNFRRRIEFRIEKSAGCPDVVMESLTETESLWGGDSNAEWMNLAVETTGVGTWEFDLEQGTGFISDRCAEIMGYPASLAGRLIRFEDWLSRIDWADRRRIDQACDPEREGELKMRLQLIDTGGVMRHVVVRGRAFFSVSRPSGSRPPLRKAVRLIGIVHALSDRQLYKRALTESDQRLRWALQRAPIPILIHADNGQVIDLNWAWQRITGYSIEEIPSLEAWAAVSWDQTSARSMLELIYSAGDGVTGRPVELAIKTRSGEIRRWLFYSAELGSINRGRQARMISAVDLTERKAAEEERNSALGEAEAANRSKDQFLATLSHELRTPLNAILGWVFLMKQGSVKPEVQKEGVLVIERNARAQSSLIADLLDISRIVAGKLRLEPRPLDFLSCLKSAMNGVRPSADEKGVHLISHIDSSVLVRIAMYGDPARLEQVLSNLLVNAIKFTPTNGSVEVSIEASESMIRLTVSDTGTGIEPEFLSRLFDRFSQADESLRKDRGLGLGLTISRHIVELHGGKIFAVSDGLGKGASFTVELPIASAQAATPQPEKLRLPNDPEQAMQTLEDVTVVAVDDNADALAFVDQVLKLHGANVVSVDTGAKAVEAVLRYHPEVVLCDLMMPGMDGYSVLRHIRKLDDEVAKSVPVIALSAFAGAENRAKTQQAGFQVHLDKPIDLPRLIETIQALVKAEAT
jgi:PAS domain S-box-containing protein